MVSACLVAALQIAGCGSGSTVTVPQQKTAKIVFSASTSAALTVPVRSLTIVANIPAGVTVPLNADGTPVFSTSKNGFHGGSFNPPLLTIGLADTSASGLGVNNVGTFAEVVVSFPSGSSITESSFTLIENLFVASGVDSADTTVVLTNSLKPSMKVTF